ncbi:MAG: hypothetical protein U9O41_01025 [Candidatus Aerophobetes bacterium]|nr:hypothetical protein [Candidatus Aerophobetes bacterium]
MLTLINPFTRLSSLDYYKKVLVQRFIQVSRDFPRRSLIEATLTNFRVEEKEKFTV